MAMDMDRVMVHGRNVTDPDSDTIPDLRDYRFRSRKRFAIKREDIEVSHFVRIRPTRANIDPPFAKHKSEIASRPRLCRIARMNHEHSHRPKRHLGHFIMMRVVHMATVLAEGEF